MYIDIVPNRGSPPAALLRESYREGGRIRKRTLANLSRLPLAQVELLRAVLRGDPLVPAGAGPEIERALPDGHVQAVLGTLRRLGLDRLLPRGPERRRSLALGLIVARLLEPAAKLATARALDAQTAGHSLGLRLGLGQVRAKEVYAALDWLGAAQPAIEAGLARPHPGRGEPGAVRRDLERSGGSLLRAGALRLQPGWAARAAADRDRPALRRRRLPGGGGGVRG
jgi:hypothetical protein